MLRRTKHSLLAALTCAFSLSAYGSEAASFPHARIPLRAAALAAQNSSDRAQDGLSGPVRRVKTEVAKISTKNGKPAEGPRVLLETATYDIKGAKVDNAYFLSAAGSALTGREVYKYDDKGNIVEMTLHQDDGTLLSKEVYAYEFDPFGNWTKMITSVAIMEGGKLAFEPTEITYRTFSYFVDEATLAKMSQPAVPPASNGVGPVSNSPANNIPASNASANANAASPASTPADNKVATSTVKPSASTHAAANKPSEEKSSRGESKMAAAPPPVALTDKSVVSVPASVASVGAGSSSNMSAPMVRPDAEAPPERVAARGPVKPISGGILNGKAISLPSPIYPEIAKRARAGGLVTIEVVIDVTGRVISAEAVSGHTMLRQAAEQAAKQARFSPTLLSGQPVRVTGQITYNFTLKQ